MLYHHHVSCWCRARYILPCCQQVLPTFFGHSPRLLLPYAPNTHGNQQHQMSKQQRDLRISSFQQITPPESLAFWQQQQQMTTHSSTMCRSACCTATASGVGVPGTYCRAVNKYSPPSSVLAPACCYPMPPTPMVTNNTNANSFCLGCAQGKCQQAAAAANAASSTKKVNMGIMRSL